MSGKKTDLTIVEKRKLIEEFQSSQKSKSAFAKEHGIPRTTLGGILSSDHATSSQVMNDKRKRMRNSTFSGVEAALLCWFQDARSQNIPISGILLKEKALQIAAESGENGFVASNGWLERFKARHNISFRKVHEDASSIDFAVSNTSKDSRMISVPKRKAIFRTLLTQEGLSRNFNAMEYEEAADLSLKKEKPPTFESREKCSYPTSYGIDETIDLSTKWRAPPVSERKAGHTSGTTTYVSSATTSDSKEPRESRGWNRSLGHHIRMQPRKRLRLSDHNFTQVSGHDLVVLSDEDRPRLNGHINGYESDSKNNGSDNEILEMPPCPEEKIWDPVELKAKKRQLKEIRDELRSEEMKLVLLKKLHQSQMIKENVFNPAAATTATVATKMVPTTNRAPPNAVPPPLVRSGLITPPSNKLLNQQISHQSSILGSSQLNSQGLHSGPPPPLIGQRGLVNNSGSSLSANIMAGMMRPGHSSMSRTPVTTPPNLSLGYSLQNMSVPNSQHQISNQIAPPSCSSPQSIHGERMDNQTPAQRQAAAKLALRKQLEKTLLQIPPPKPPPPEMHFIPNANNQEFICLLGLEKCVDCLIDDPNINRPPPEPFECVQCGTDFSPVWKWQDAGNLRHRKPAVICETCVTSNIKKALKAEHTNRLKTAFVKALQQEQEIEQRMSQALPSPPPHASPTHTPSSTPTPAIVSSCVPAVPTPPAPHSPIHSMLPKMGSGPSSSMLNSVSLMQHLPKLSAAHQSLLQAQAQHLQQFAQSLPQPQPAHMLPFAPLLAQAYSYQLLGKSPMTSAELQRQYLLDMIPPRSLPQSSMNWKT